LFDGVCNLCSGSVQFIIRHDARGRIRFASLQSPAAQAILQQFNAHEPGMNSMVLVANGRLHTRSSAVLRTALHMGGVWRLAGVLLLVPPVVRDAVYNWVAHNRYRWFGKQEACWVPTPQLQARFLN
jgi:predicted DCC family thiol-disulfide oxidoreductase YuxK